MILDYRFVTTFLVITSCVAATLANQNTCNCRCLGRHQVCDILSTLKTAVDVNTAENRKWSQHYNFLRRFHYSWEDEVAQTIKQQLEANPSWYQPSGPKLDEIHKMVLEYREQNLELQRKMSGIETRLQAAEDRAKRLESELKNEREARDLLQTEAKRQELLLEGENTELKNKISSFKKDFEERVNTLQSQLDKENEARNKIKDEVDEMRPTFHLFIPGDFEAMKNSSRQFGRQLQRLEGQNRFHGYAFNRDQDNIRSLQSDLGKMQGAVLKAANALRPFLPPGVADNMEKELRVKLDVPTEDIVFNVTTKPISVAHATNATFGNHLLPNSRYTEMNSKLEDLDSKMKTLNNSIGKAMSNIKILENKYKDASTTLVRSGKRQRPKGFEIVAPHEKHGSRRPFDPLWDP